MAAKHYIYRNLHNGGKRFSIRYRGKVIDRSCHVYAEDVELSINLKGQLKAIREGQRNVHAYVVANQINVDWFEVPKKAVKITYNPFSGKGFYVKQTGQQITHLKQCWCCNGEMFGVI